jgi:exodeoxyribonuclease V alpha subunit
MSLLHLHRAETAVASFVKRCAAAERRALPATPALSEELSEAQRRVVESVVRGNVSVVTGGPGTGKTRILRDVAASFHAHGMSVHVVTVAARAAKRVRELALIERSTTIHKALEQDEFACDVLVVEEASMVDLELMARLVEHIAACAPARAPPVLVLVGDADQIQPMHPGGLLKPLLDPRLAHLVRVHRLTESYRYSLGIAKASANCKDKVLPPPDSPDFVWVSARQPAASPAAAGAVEGGSAGDASFLAEVIERECLAKGFTFQDIQVLVGQHEQQTHARIRDMFNPPFSALEAAEEFRAGDRVYHCENALVDGVSMVNGDVGVVEQADYDASGGRFVVVAFPDAQVKYSDKKSRQYLRGRFRCRRRADGTNPPPPPPRTAGAFALSVHKAQGSEYPCVVVCISPDQLHTWLANGRALLYTALTRAQRRLVLVAEKRHLGLVYEVEPLPRLTWLCERILQPGLVSESLPAAAAAAAAFPLPAASAISNSLSSPSNVAFAQSQQPDGSWTCTCSGFQARRRCLHVDRIAK